MRTDSQPIHDLPHLRDLTRVFRDRTHAGMVLAEMLHALACEQQPLILSIPAGGIPVGAVIARELRLPLGVVVVSKITPPFNSEVGYGAVAFDGSVRLNKAILPTLHLGQGEIRSGIARTKKKVARRVKEFGAGKYLEELGGRMGVLVDDGVASGHTMGLAADALRNAGAWRIVIAVPTAHEQSIRTLTNLDEVYCPNIRSGMTFAVADAYQNWRDVSEKEAARILKGFAK